MRAEVLPAPMALNPRGMRPSPKTVIGPALSIPLGLGARTVNIWHRASRRTSLEGIECAQNHSELKQHKFGGGVGWGGGQGGE